MRYHSFRVLEIECVPGHETLGSDFELSRILRGSVAWVSGTEYMPAGSIPWVFTYPLTPAGESQVSTYLLLAHAIRNPPTL